MSQPSTAAGAATDTDTVVVVESYAVEAVTAADVAPDPRRATPTRYVIITRDGESSFAGVLAAAVSSASNDHNHPTTVPSVVDGNHLDVPCFAGRGQRCNACRWFEVRLYVIEGDRSREYVVHTVGMSRVPGEVPYQRVRRTTSAYELVEFLTVRKTANVFLPPSSARALARLAEFYDDVRDAYVNRAVI